MNLKVSTLHKELAEKDSEITELRKELIEHRSKTPAIAKVDTNLEEARKLAALDAEKKKKLE